MFTENQSRQLYVVSSVVTGNNLVTNSSSAGATKLKATPGNKEFFFIHKGATADALQRTDLIDKCKIMDIRATDAADMVHNKMLKEVVLDSNVSATAVVGQDYILNVIIKNYIANGDDSIKVKFAAARAYSTTASDLYKKLAINLAKNLSREAVPMIKITLKGDANHTEITNRTKVADLSSITATGIILEEVEQPWRLGIAKQEFVNFDVIPSVITVGGVDQVWGSVTDNTASNTNTIPNSKEVADMEYFFHKNRGDVYGKMCYSTDIDTVYMVNPASTDGYSFLDIHYYYEGNSHNIGHSEKTLTLVGTKTELKKIVGTAAVPAGGNNPALPATGLMAILEGTNVTIKTSASW